VSTCAPRRRLLAAASCRQCSIAGLRPARALARTRLGAPTPRARSRAVCFLDRFKQLKQHNPGYACPMGVAGLSVLEQNQNGRRIRECARHADFVTARAQSAGNGNRLDAEFADVDAEHRKPAAGVVPEIYAEADPGLPGAAAAAPQRATGAASRIPRAATRRRLLSR